MGDKKMKSKCKHRGVAHPAPAATHENAVQTNSTSDISGMEEIAQLDSSGVPFILIDGVRVTTRRDLNEALSKREKKRMAHLHVICNDLPLLDSIRLQFPAATMTTPSKSELPSTAAHAIASLKAVEDELKFQADLEQLSKPMLEFSQPGTPTAHSSSFEDLQQAEAEVEAETESHAIDQSAMLQDTTSNLEQIRSKLEQLRQHQEKAMHSTSTTVPNVPLAERPGIKRQRTFEIKRVNGTTLKSQLRQQSAQVEGSPSTSSLRTANKGTILQQPQQSKSAHKPLTRGVSSMQLSGRPTPSKLQRMRTTTQLVRKPSEIDQEKGAESDASEIPDLVNQIGELLIQLQEKQQQRQQQNQQEEQPSQPTKKQQVPAQQPEAHLEPQQQEIQIQEQLPGGASFSYLVTITPDSGISNCSVQPLTSPKLNAKQQQQQHMVTFDPAVDTKSQPMKRALSGISLLPTPRNAGITIFAPKSAKDQPEITRRRAIPVTRSVTSLTFDRNPTSHAEHNFHLKDNNASTSRTAAEISDKPEVKTATVIAVPKSEATSSTAPSPAGARPTLTKSRTFLKPPSSLFRANKK
ncbi:AP2-associated protein kinase 1-like [Scaptodrosophila lebanonensis]|uniref:AP2-associated protein kinase 1-like n=1 Tax=Drosophila lebanonensis TaxID=7225 RepID=A0A6J2T1C0_DROLE|nr:AP2-associated protein kinase 1-like [Scaptodrosophila lebanonensis]XP_030370701.1 AP2-associated protein kinase 1-like [Scaptodrosophila lebanonensis]